MSRDDKRGQKVLHDFDQLHADAREAERRLGRQPKQAYTLEEGPAADDMIVLAAALRTGLLDAAHR
jgi:hypothetical protein